MAENIIALSLFIENAISYMKTLTNGTLTIKVDPLGAELTSIVNNSTGREYLWQADPAYWKRHSPILFPIVGGVWNGRYFHEGREYQLSQHGFARDKEFELILDLPNEVRYRLTSNVDTLKVYPFPFELQIGYKLNENKVEVIWEVRNTGIEDMYFQIGAHPAFYYPDFDISTEERGYFAFDKKDELEYLLIHEKGCVLPSDRHSLELIDGLLPIYTYTFDEDALILEDSQVTKVALLDNKKVPFVTLHFTAPAVGLWSPPHKDAPFVCIEPWYGRCDRVGYSGEFKDRDWMNKLMSEKLFEASYSIEIG